MPAGDLIEADTSGMPYLAELEGYLLGDRNPWKLTEFAGLGSVANDGDKVPRSFTPGLASGLHVAQAGGIVFSALSLGCTDAAGMEEAIFDVETAWAIATATRDPLELHLLVPFRGHVSVLGWPEQAEVTRILPANGQASVVCTFQRVDVTVTPYVGGGS
jgi:hypothetical protein